MTAATEIPAAESMPPDFGQLVGELDWIIFDALASQPRSLQTRIGPSEIGIPCARRIGYKLAGVAPVNDRGVPWKPFIGTSVHAMLAEIFARFNRANDPDDPRFLIEHKVDVGEVAGEIIDGSCDLHDTLTRTVIDWKIVGKDQLAKYRKNGPGDQYRIQAHTYGRGWERRGYAVDRVAVVFLPRDLEYDKRVVWHEDYDEQIAIDALTRVNGIAQLVAAAGTGALPLLPTADAWCAFCPHYLPASTELGDGCPGHPGSAARITTT